MLKHDLKQGIIKYIWIYMLLAFVVYWGGTFFVKDTRRTLKYENSKYEISGVGIALYMLQGEEGERTNVSVRWLLPLFFMSYVIYAYPVYDLRAHGYNYMLRAKSKVRWWFAKCAWLVLHILACAVTLLLVSGFCAWVHGEPAFAMPNRPVLESLNLLGLYRLYHMDRLHMSAVFVLMFLTALALATLQMLFSFIFSPIAAYLGIIAVYIASGYKMTWLLPGNYLMLQRMRDAASSRWEGLNQWIGIPYMVLLLVAALFGGAAYMKRRDIL